MQYPERENLCVCKHCLCAIESREGKQFTRAFEVDEDDEVNSRCEWCDEWGFYTLYELL